MRTQDVRPGHRAKGVVATDQAGKGEEAEARMTVQRKVGGGSTCMVAQRLTEHDGGVTVLTRRWTKVGIRHQGRCNTSRRHDNGYQSGLRAASEASGGERVLAAMADTHGDVVCSHVTVAVAVKQR